MDCGVVEEEMGSGNAISLMSAIWFNSSNV